MVKSHALILVPISKLDCLAQAFITVSCTRSSALSCLPVSDTAKARRLGKVDSISRLKEVGSAVMPLFSVTRSILGLVRLFRAVELFQQIEQLLGNTFVLNRAIEGTQTCADVRIRTQPIICPPRLRSHTLLGHQFVLHHAVSRPPEILNCPPVRAECPHQPTKCTVPKKVPHISELCSGDTVFWFRVTTRLTRHWEFKLLTWSPQIA